MLIQLLERVDWVHPDDVLEVKTFILRHLPVLVYNPPSSKSTNDGGGRGVYDDPTITSLYLDNSRLSLYTNKVEGAPHASSLRLRWYGKFSEQAEITIEKKTILDGDISDDVRIAIKPKYVQPFLRGEYRMAKTIQKLREQQQRAGGPSASSSLTPDVVTSYTKSVDEIQRLSPSLCPPVTFGRP